LGIRNFEEKLVFLENWRFLSAGGFLSRLKLAGCVLKIKPGDYHD